MTGPQLSSPNPLPTTLPSSSMAASSFLPCFSEKPWSHPLCSSITRCIQDVIKSHTLDFKILPEPDLSAPAHTADAGPSCQTCVLSHCWGLTGLVQRRHSSQGDPTARKVSFCHPSVCNDFSLPSGQRPKPGQPKGPFHSGSKHCVASLLTAWGSPPPHQCCSPGRSSPPPRAPTSPPRALSHRELWAKLGPGFPVGCELGPLSSPRGRPPAPSRLPRGLPMAHSGLTSRRNSTLLC